MKKLARYICLALLSAVTAEFLLGDQWLTGAAPAGQQVAELLLYVLFYGSAAVLIREVTRRSGRGWPTMLILAFAFGLVEEGIVDQSLFNPDFAGQHLLHYGYVPALGIGGPWTIFVLTLHVIWSMGAPIAIAEALFPRPIPGAMPVGRQVQAPWFGRVVPVVAAVLMLLGAAAIFAGTSLTAATKANGWQLGASLAIAAVVVVVALRLPRRVPRATGNVWIAALISLVLTSAFQAEQNSLTWLSPWAMCGLLVVTLGIGVVLAVRLRLDILGLAGGAVLTYAWTGLIAAARVGAWPVVEQVVIALLMIGVVATAMVVRRRAAATPLPPELVEAGVHRS